MNLSAQIIGVRDLFKRFKEVMNYVAKGGEFVIVRHSKPVAKIVPYEQKFIDSEEELDKIVPTDALHASIIEGHREYLRGETVSLEEVMEEIKRDEDVERKNAEKCTQKAQKNGASASEKDQ